jgi:hypothetical protein
VFLNRSGFAIALASNDRLVFQPAAVESVLKRAPALKYLTLTLTLSLRAFSLVIAAMANLPAIRVGSQANPATRAVAARATSCRKFCFHPFR